MLNIKVLRKRESWDFKLNPSEPDSFSNNIKNNMKDSFIVCDDKAEILRVPVQSVANYCWGEQAASMRTKAGDTIAQGPFKVKCFVEPRNYEGEIHGIVEATDMDGQRINSESMQSYGDGQTAGRWLIHSTYNKEKQRESAYAYSAGCLILSRSNLETLNAIFHAYGIKRGQILSGEIIEEAK